MHRIISVFTVLLLASLLGCAAIEKRASEKEIGALDVGNFRPLEANQIRRFLYGNSIEGYQRWYWMDANGRKGSGEHSGFRKSYFYFNPNSELMASEYDNLFIGDRRKVWQVEHYPWVLVGDQLCFYRRRGKSGTVCSKVYMNDLGTVKFVFMQKSWQDGFVPHEAIGKLKKGDPRNVANYQNATCIMSAKPRLACCRMPNRGVSLDSLYYGGNCKARAAGWKPPSNEEINAAIRQFFIDRIAE